MALRSGAVLGFSGAGPVAWAARGGGEGAGWAWGADGCLQLCLHPEDQGRSSVGFPGNPGGHFISPIDVFVS